MNCEEAIEYIHSLEHFGIKPGLERISALCSLLGDPQNKVKFVHVAGTNGKGSTSTMTANMLIAAGYSVGLFTSPYVVDFRERIQLNGSMISPEDLADYTSEVKKAADKLAGDEIYPTEFEVITAVALLYFAQKKCDIAVLEVGLGGRFDSTNVIPAPLVSVITSISLDHMAVLGNTVTEIAGEKCGIIKPGSVCVSYPAQLDEAKAVIEKKCRECNIELIVPDKEKINVSACDVFGSRFTYGTAEISLPLTGEHMVFNAVTAVEAVKALAKKGFNVTDTAIKKGIASCAMPARLEIIRKAPLTVLDGGHNEGCAQALAKYIDTYLGNKRIVALCAMMADKDCDAYLELVASRCSAFVASKVNVPRSHTACALKQIAEKYCKNCFEQEDSQKALELAKSMTGEEDVLLICGSFYFAGEIRDFI